MGRRRKRKHKRANLENPDVPLTGGNIGSALGGGRSSSGSYVSPRSALMLSPIWSAIDLISGDIGRIPWITYSRDGRSRAPAEDHPVFNLLRKHTGEMTSNLWISRMLGQALLFGNAFSRIVFNGGEVSRLEWLHRDQVQVEKRDGVIRYLVNYDGYESARTGVQMVPDEDMFHLQGLTFDDLGGLSVIDYARNEFGSLQSGEHYGADYFNNNATPSGFIEHPGELKGAAASRLRKTFDAVHSGDGRRFKTAVLEEGATWKQVGASLADAQLVEKLKWDVKNVARRYKLPPHKLGDSDKVAFKSLEEENRSYFDSSLGSWVSRLEFEANYKLFHPRMESDMFTSFNQDDWNKADTKSRFDSYRTAIESAVMSPNEARQKENLNPYEGGDTYAPIPQLGGAPQPGPQTIDDDDTAEDDEQDRSSVQLNRRIIASRDVLADKLTWSFRLLGSSASRAAKHPSEFLARINGLETKFAAKINDALRPPLNLAIDEPDYDSVTYHVFETARDQLLSAAECPPEELQDRVVAVASSWSSYAAEYATQLVLGTSNEE